VRARRLAGEGAHAPPSARARGRERLARCGGIWRRIHSIPFVVRIADEQVDPERPAKLRAEAPGILNWMLAGCLDWQRHGLRAPASVIEATKAYRLGQDVLGKFLDGGTLAEASCEPRALYRAYQKWAESTGERAVTERDFGEALAEKGVERRSSNGRRYWRGLRVLPEYMADPFTVRAATWPCGRPPCRLA
jgi:putative DNA primase/helicase